MNTSSNTETVSNPQLDLSKFRTVQPTFFIARLLLLLLLGCCGIVGIIITHGVYSLLSQILVALVMAHGTELAHQCIHRTGTGSAFWDRAIGIVLCWPTTVCFSYYKWFHLWHHKKNGSNEDIESFGYTYLLMQNGSLAVRLTGFVRHALMVEHFVNTLRRFYLAICGKLVDRLRGEMPQMSLSAARRIQREYLFMIISYLFVFVCCGLAGISIIRLWVIPVLFWAPVHALIELPEHWATAKRPNRNVFENTRTIRAGSLANWFTNANCYHVEHHMHPAIPMQRLDELHATLLQNGVECRYLDKGYYLFYRNFFRSLCTGANYSDTCCRSFKVKKH